MDAVEDKIEKKKQKVYNETLAELGREVRSLRPSLRA